MKKLGIYTLGLALALVFIQACGPSEEERRAAEQARLDSLRQAEQQRIEAMMQAREDSLARVAEMEEKEEEEEPIFVEGGSYAVQLGAYRSEEEANEYKDMLSGRDYPHVYVVKVGNEETGDVWFRLRVGFMGTKDKAEELGAQLGQELNSGYWVSKVERSASSM